MSEKDPKEMAKDFFTTDLNEMLGKQLPRIKDWFDVTGGKIAFKIDLEELSKGEKYLAYLLGSYVAEIAEERDTKYVENEEVDSRFGWSSERSSAQYASDFSEMLDSGEEGKGMDDRSLETVIDKISEKVDK